ncbi:MAG TPA: FmdB family zinc ribbon protein [Thermoanaerobaculia bacterium]|nr:FmdB family zinc ribbon protein [Thermoanaerobaculia bacterium]
MPLYEYECTQCAERVEIIQNLSDPPYSHCPKCGGDMKKLFSAPAIQFKGTGWYKTDYAGSGKKSESKSETPDSKTESKSEAKTESKSEPKSETKSESKAGD